MEKYEITEHEYLYSTNDYGGVIKLHQIRATRDIKREDVKIGDLGGWIESERNLSQEGDCWLSPDCYVLREAIVSGDASIRGESIIDFRSKVRGRAVVLNSVVHGTNVIEGQALIINSKLVGRCELEGLTRIEASHVEGVKSSNNARIKSSELVSIDKPLLLPRGSVIKDSKVQIRDSECWIAKEVSIVGVEAKQVESFRVYVAGSVLGHQDIGNLRRIRIGNYKGETVSPPQ